MATRGNSNQIIVGAAQLFVSKQGPLEYATAQDVYGFSASPTVSGYPSISASGAYADKLEADSTRWRNVGYTMNGLEVQFQPDFGEVQVDQLLDVAKLYKQGMQVSMVTAFAEATLENLLVSIAAADSTYDATGATINSSGRLTAGEIELDITAGELGEVPVERALIAVGPGSGDPAATGSAKVERVYVGNRVLSIENVTVSAKRDEPSMYEVTFRLLPASNGSYGKIVDRVVGN
jgi:hypothetical protein